ncbi:luciferase family protein [Nitrososphaera sp.]|uniref:luciferase family protein n=1 Tax=Nitrososphaera sp. TaxID=1971748 RepID=UPI00307EC776
MEGAAEAIKSELLTRDGATVHEHQFGSVVFRAAGEETGHLHLGGAMADIHIRLPACLPAKTIKKLLSEGRVSCAPPLPTTTTATATATSPHSQAGQATRSGAPATSRRLLGFCGRSTRGRQEKGIELRAAGASSMMRPRLHLYLASISLETAPPPALMQV